jgi:hypothetical protein
MFANETLAKAILTLQIIVANPDRFIPQPIRNQLDDSNWNQAFDINLKRFQNAQTWRRI